MPRWENIFFQEKSIWLSKLASFSKQFVLQSFRKRGFNWPWRYLWKFYQLQVTQIFKFPNGISQVPAQESTQPLDSSNESSSILNIDKIETIGGGGGGGASTAGGAPTVAPSAGATFASHLTSGLGSVVGAAGFMQQMPGRAIRWGHCFTTDLTYWQCAVLR